MVNEIGQQTIVSEFDGHWVSHILAMCQTKQSWVNE